MLRLIKALLRYLPDFARLTPPAIEVTTNPTGGWLGRSWSLETIFMTAWIDNWKNYSAIGVSTLLGLVVATWLG